MMSFRRVITHKRKIEMNERTNEQTNVQMGNHDKTILRTFVALPLFLLLPDADKDEEEKMCMCVM